MCGRGRALEELAIHPGLRRGADFPGSRGSRRAPTAPPRGTSRGRWPGTSAPAPAGRPGRPRERRRRRRRSGPPRRGGRGADARPRAARDRAPSPSSAHACSPAATTRPSRSVRNAGDGPGPAIAVPSAAAARSRQSVLDRQLPAACSKALRIDVGEGDECRPPDLGGPLPSNDPRQTLCRLRSAELAQRFRRLDLDADQRIVEQRRRAWMPTSSPGSSRASAAR